MKTTFQTVIIEIEALLHAYLENHIKGAELVMRYDHLVIQESIDWNAPDPIIKLIDNFQGELSLYVENPEWRKEHNSYYGDEILSRKVKIYLSDLEFALK
jgi:hypothetical protein